MNSLVFKNGLLVNEGQIIEGDLAIEGQRITQIGGTAVGSKEIDVAGAWILPGMIDDQVHFREPGLEHKGSIATESRAAVAGGITSYMEMPNCIPQTLNHDRLLEKHERAANCSLANYGFYLGASNDNIEDIKRVDPSKACGIKVFMGASTGNMLVDDEAVLEEIFRSAPTVIATHCEHTPTILENEAAARAKFGENVPATEHPHIRSEEACYRSSSLAVGLAKKHNARLHVLHLTTAREMELFEEGSVESKKITAEVCVHHLFFNESSYAAKGAEVKCNPAIKKRSDQLALKRALMTDRIDVIATDHAPHTKDEKAQPFNQAPAGLPLVQHALLTLAEGVKLGDFTIEKIVQKTSHAPAVLFDVKERGFLRDGYFADIVVLDPNTPTVVDEEPIFAKCGWTPFHGFSFATKVKHTVVNGELLYSNGTFLSTETGLALEYTR